MESYGMLDNSYAMNNNYSLLYEEDGLQCTPIGRSIGRIPFTHKNMQIELTPERTTRPPRPNCGISNCSRKRKQPEMHRNLDIGFETPRAAKVIKIKSCLSVPPTRRPDNTAAVISGKRNCSSKIRTCVKSSKPATYTPYMCQQSPVSQRSESKKRPQCVTNGTLRNILDMSVINYSSFEQDHLYRNESFNSVSDNTDMNDNEAELGFIASPRKSKASLEAVENHDYNTSYLHEGRKLTYDNTENSSGDSFTSYNNSYEDSTTFLDEGRKLTYDTTENSCGNSYLDNTLTDADSVLEDSYNSVCNNAMIVDSDIEDALPVYCLFENSLDTTILCSVLSESEESLAESGCETTYAVDSSCMSTDESPLNFTKNQNQGGNLILDIAKYMIKNSNGEISNQSSSFMNVCLNSSDFKNATCTTCIGDNSGNDSSVLTESNYSSLESSCGLYSSVYNSEPNTMYTTSSSAYYNSSGFFSRSVNTTSSGSSDSGVVTGNNISSSSTSPKRKFSGKGDLTGTSEMNYFIDMPMRKPTVGCKRVNKRRSIAKKLKQVKKYLTNLSNKPTKCPKNDQFQTLALL